MKHHVIFTPCDKIYVKYLILPGNKCLWLTQVFWWFHRFLLLFLSMFALIKLVVSTQVRWCREWKREWVTSPLEHNAVGQTLTWFTWEPGMMKQLPPLLASEKHVAGPRNPVSLLWLFIVQHQHQPVVCGQVCTSGLGPFLFVASSLDVSYCEYGENALPATA